LPEAEAGGTLDTKSVGEILRKLNQLLQKELLEEVVYLQLQQDIFTDSAASSGLVLTSQGHATRIR